MDFILEYSNYIIGYFVVVFFYIFFVYMCVKDNKNFNDEYECEPNVGEGEL